MTDPAFCRYEFGRFSIDNRERLLCKEGDLVPLPPKAVDTLLVLLSSSGRMVDKAELLKAVWPDSFVEEGALARNISLLRRSLGDTAEEPAYIETIPKRGYRFVAPVLASSLEVGATEVGTGKNQVEEATGPAGQRHEEPVVAPVVRRPLWRARWRMGIALVAAIVMGGGWFGYELGKSRASERRVVSGGGTTLAISPFRNVTSEREQEYFAQGLTEALVTALQRLGKVRIVYIDPRSGQAAFERMVREQSLKYVLKGTTLRAGSRARVHAQLVDPQTQVVWWANDYDRDIKDVMSLESELAEAIAVGMQVGLTQEDADRLRPRRMRPEAVEEYMKGRYFWNQRTEAGLKEAVSHFKRAIELDGSYALAYAGLADSYSLLGSIGVDGMQPTIAMPLAKEAAQTALRMDPNLAEAHVSLAYVKFSYDWDLEGAGEEFARAMALNPGSATAHHWYSHFYMASNELEKARREMEAALRLDPFSPIINVGMGWCHYYARNYDEAIQYYQTALRMNPEFATGRQTLGMAYQHKGLHQLAVENLKLAVLLSGERPSPIASLASAYASAGRKDEARRELARLQEMAKKRYVPSLYFAQVYLELGENAETFRWLECGWGKVGLLNVSEAGTRGG